MKSRNQEVEKSLSEKVENLERDYRELRFQNFLNELQLEALREVNERVEKENIQLKKELSAVAQEKVLGKQGKKSLKENYRDDEEYGYEDDLGYLGIDLNEVIREVEKLSGQKVVGVIPLEVEDEDLALVLAGIFNASAVVIVE